MVFGQNSQSGGPHFWFLVEIFILGVKIFGFWLKYIVWGIGFLVLVEISILGVGIFGFWIKILIWVENVSTTDSDKERLVSPLRVRLGSKFFNLLEKNGISGDIRFLVALARRNVHSE